MATKKFHIKRESWGQRTRRRQRAAEQNAARAQRSDAMQLAVLDERRGNSTLERFLPAHRPPTRNPPTLMANPIVPTAWHVVECFASMDTALPRAAKAKDDPAYKGAVLRIRDRRDNMIIMCAILG